MKKIIVPLMMLVLLAIPVFAYDPTSPYSKNITINNSYEDVTNFTFMIPFYEGWWNFSQARDDGNDIRFFNNSQQLEHKKVFYNGTENKGLFVVTSQGTISQGTNYTIEVSFGNSSYSIDSSVENIYANNPDVTMFWYFDQNNATIRDWKGNNDLTRTGTFSSDTGCFFGDGCIQRTYGGNRYFASPSVVLDNDMTVISLVDFEQYSGAGGLPSFHQIYWSHGNAGNSWALGESHSMIYLTNNRFFMTHHNGGIRDFGSNVTDTMTIHNWYLLTQIWDSDSFQKYHTNDTLMINRTDNLLGTSRTTMGSRPFYVGSGAGTEGSATANGIHGDTQFVLVANSTIYSDDRVQMWFDMLYQNNTFYNFGILEELPEEPEEEESQYTPIQASIIAITTIIVALGVGLTGLRTLLTGKVTLETIVAVMLGVIIVVVLIGAIVGLV